MVLNRITIRPKTKQGERMSERLSNEELAERGWSRCSNCGTIRSPYTGLDFYNHATEDCIYSTEEGFVITTTQEKEKE